MKNIFLVIIVCVFFISCKTKTVYDKAAYEDIMDHSVQLFAKEEQGKRHGVAAANRDTLSKVYKNHNPQIDSVDAVHKERFKNDKNR